MSLFQTQIERQYLASITTDLHPLYTKFSAYFANPSIQANILEVNEEQYQGEFIRALFVDILGYTAQPEPNFNLLREKKNENDSKSADAAISINNQIVAVVELKDHKTQDLKKVEVQAFGYKNNHKNCHYIVTSNFERLRFYIDNAVDFIEFDLFNLTFEEFKRLWLCLSYDSISKNLPLTIKHQSISNEDIITKKLYKDYSVFKRLLFDNIVLLNPEHDKLLLFKKTQKLLDRFLFLFFAEDKSLLPANSIQGTVEKWQKFNADPMNDGQPLYSRFIKYFKLLDEGYKDADIEIYAYNGGLFANDELLNQIKIDDAILTENVLKLAKYDYDTDVDVNILGHIFENSLSEIEEVISEINQSVKTISKRKQDGVIYTPRYITQYIVENTIGKLCEEKKQQVGIGETLFEYKRADKRKQALQVFDMYREWLLQITIVDPACGSGAFLNSALDFLIAEHKWIDSQQEKIAGLKGHYSMQLANIENTILENNLFGVDINDESVEIAKLSLWLRTAKPHRKLSSLNNNIKCGNSLIDDPAIAGEKAFDWHKEFPQVFGRQQKTEEPIIFPKDEVPDYRKLIKEKSVEAQQKAEQGVALSKEALEISNQIVEYAEKLFLVSEPQAIYEKRKTGFDVVIGNPPYVRNEYISATHKSYFEKNYKTFSGKADLYVYFFEQALRLLKTHGKTGFIVSSKYTKTKYGKILIDFLQTNSEIKAFIDFKDLDVFQGIIAYPSIILFNNKKISAETNYPQLLVISNENYSEIENNFVNSVNVKQSELFSKLGSWTAGVQDDKLFNLFNKITSKNKKLEDFDLKPQVGIKTGLNAVFIFKPKDVPSIIDKSALLKDYLGGRDIKRYGITSNNNKILFPYIIDEKTNILKLVEGLTSYEKEYNFLSNNRDALSRRAIIDIGLISGTKKWYEFQQIKLDFKYHLEYIIYPDISSDVNFTLVSDKLMDMTCFGIPSNSKSLLGILNSKLIKTYLETICVKARGGYLRLKNQYLLQLPIPEKFEQEQLDIKVTEMLTLNKELQVSTHKFQRMLHRKFDLEELPVKLQNWYSLSYKEFIAELGKKKVKLTLGQEAEWEEYFITECTKTLAIKAKIETTDHEIDRIVYQLYDLTEDEIKIVEGK